MKETVCMGIPAAPGYASGRILIYRKHSDGGKDGKPLEKSFENPEGEIGRWRRTVRDCLEHFGRLRENALQTDDSLTAELMDAYCEMASDEELSEEIVRLLNAESLGAAEAVDRVFAGVIDDMLALEEEYARQRVDDMKTVRDSLLKILAGESLEVDLSFPEEGAVLWGDDLTPADTAPIPKDRLLGIVSRSGGVTSHVAILAKNMGIPAVLGVKCASENIQEIDFAILDGCEGKLVLAPEETTCRDYERKKSDYEKERQERESLRDLPARTRDGRRIRLMANIGSLEEAELAVKQGAEGIGLFRTEFLFMNSGDAPREEEQYRVYRRVLEIMDGKPVVFRTLDIGGDKPVPYIAFPAEDNPFLGRRACRMYDAYPEIILSQLRALLRASVHGNAKVMFPMISRIDEIDTLLARAEEAKLQLSSENKAFSGSLPLGIMVETPAAALVIDDLLAKIDFCSIGTNDLTQYTLAVDRGNIHVASLYDVFHPAVLRLIRETVQTALSRGKNVSVCGELAGNAEAIPFFLDIGLDCLSMTPSSIPEIKQRIRLF